MNDNQQTKEQAIQQIKESYKGKSDEELNLTQVQINYLLGKHIQKVTDLHDKIAKHTNMVNNLMLQQEALADIIDTNRKIQNLKGES